MGFKREPALLALPVLTTIVGFICQALSLNAVTTAAVTAVAIALGAVVTAALAKPLHPTVLAGAVLAALTLVSHYWVHLPAGGISLLASVVTLVVTAVVRHQITPVTGVPARA